MLKLSILLPPPPPPPTSKATTEKQHPDLGGSRSLDQALQEPGIRDAHQHELEVRLVEAAAQLHVLELQVVGPDGETRLGLVAVRADGGALQRELDVVQTLGRVLELLQVVGEVRVQLEHQELVPLQQLRVRDGLRVERHVRAVAARHQVFRAVGEELRDRAEPLLQVVAGLARQAVELAPRDFVQTGEERECVHGRHAGVVTQHRRHVRRPQRFHVSCRTHVLGHVE